MKTFILLFYFGLLSICVFSQQIDRRISRLNNDTYQITYPNQLISVYFDYSPRDGLQKIVSKTDLNENEKYEVARIIKQQIDQLPEIFINKYLSVEIYPLHIENNSEFGYNLGQQIIIEADKIKQGMSYRNSVKSSLAHQIAYLLNDDMGIKKSAKDLQKYLNSLHQTFYHSYKDVGYSIYEKGYVSRYANGELTGRYTSTMEFAEIFAHLICDENRSDLLEFIDSQPENILSIKVWRFIEFLTKNVEGFDRNYFFPSEESAYSTPTRGAIDGEVLLSVHELRSYEAMDFEAMGNDQSSRLSVSDKNIYEDLPTKSWEESEQEHEVYSYSEQSDTFDPNQQQNEKNIKKKKKKNGTGLLITGAAIYVLLQLLK